MQARKQNVNQTTNTNVSTSAKKPAEITPVDSDKEIAEIAEGLLQCVNWSEKIRYLASKGFRNSSIAYLLSELRGYPLLPNHVSNVLRTPLKSHARGPDPRASKVINRLQKK